MLKLVKSGSARGNPICPLTCLCTSSTAQHINQSFSNPPISIIANLIVFKSDGRYVNLSRVSLDQISARYMTETRHEFAKDSRTAICIAVGAVRESALVVTLGTSFPYHALRIVLLSYKHERSAAAIGGVSRRSSLVTQIWNSAITFGTKTQNTKTGMSLSLFFTQIFN